MLASYLVSTGQFTHPISRRELTHQECAALDSYLAEHRLRSPSVVDAYERREEYASGNPPPDSRLASLRAEADTVLQALFAGTSARRTGRAHSAAQPQTAAVRTDGNMSLVDDDQMPSHMCGGGGGTASAAAAGIAGAAAAAPAAAVAPVAAVAPAAEGVRVAEAATAEASTTTSMFPVLPPGAAPVLQQSRLPSRHGPARAVRNAWGVSAPDGGGGGGGGGWHPDGGRSAGAAPASSAAVWRTVEAREPPTRPASAVGAKPGSAVQGCLAAVPAAWAATGGGGGGCSVNRVPSTDVAAPPAKTKGQKKAAAKQRKAQQAAMTTDGAHAADESSEGAARDGDEGGQGGGSAVERAGGASTSAAARQAPATGAAAVASQARQAALAAQTAPRAPPHVVCRPTTVEEAKGRHRALVARLRSRLEAAGMGASEATEAISHFKAASGRYVQASPDVLAGRAPEYVADFLGLFGSEGSAPLLVELTALLPSHAHSQAMGAALCTRWGLAALPIVDAPLHRSSAPPPPVGSAPAAASPPSAPPTAGAAALSAAAARTSALAPPASAPPPASARWSVATGPTYSCGSGPKAVNATAGVRAAASTTSAAAARRRPEATTKVAPRVTLAYAAAQQAAARQKQAAASASPPPSSDATTATPRAAAAGGSAAAAAAALAAAQFAEEESLGSAAALRAAMQYSSQVATSGSVRRRCR